MIPTVTNPLGIPPYQRLQYIESTGTQYIDTGVKPDYANGDKIEIDFYLAYPGHANYTMVFGSRAPAALNGFYMTVDARTVFDTIMQALAGDSNGYQQLSMFPSPEKYWGEDVKAEVNSNSIKVSSIHYNGTYTFTKQVTSQYSVYIFALNQEDAVLNAGIPIYPGMRLYDWKYWRNGTLAQHLIPVLDRSGVPCLYDTVTRTLKRNAGSGTFDYA